MSIKRKLKVALPVAGLTVAAGAIMKQQNICPLCVAKRVLNATRITYKNEGRFENGVALTPPMGWSSWNLFRHRINEDLIYEIAEAMAKSGLKDAGYTYVNIDDCWQSSSRDKNGRLQADLATFPSGIKNLAERVNALGLKLGIYSSNGTLTCEDLPASLYNEAIDADTFAEWGIEYFKYDFCHNKPIPTSAPDIDKIIITKPNEKEGIVIEAETGRLTGKARVAEDSKLETGKYVTGLSANGGALIFDEVEVDEDGEYILTIGLRKAGLYQKYAEIVVNEKDCYDAYFPSTKGFTHEGRHQITIKLNKGVNSIKIHNPVASRMDSAIIQYTKMGKELKRATKEYAERTGQPEKPIVYSICEWCVNRPWKWGAGAGNLWRTTMDIKAFWASILAIYEFNVRLYKYAGPGNWNDPDMLEVGNGNLTDDENKAHFSLWCMMAAPLILGNDIRTFLKPDGTPDTENKIYKIVTNKDMIAIDQDRRGIQCRRIRTTLSLVDVLVKPLENKELAVCLFNKGEMAAKGEFSIRELTSLGFIDLPKAAVYEVKDIWENEIFTSQDKVSAELPKHSVKVYRIKAITD
ncbi:MAG: alpha-galactosidase [Clostridiales bacterium]|nr:alpha-galactosidase [Clostridiales bacterium]